MPTPTATVVQTAVDLLNGTNGLAQSLLEYSATIQMTGVTLMGGAPPGVPVVEASHVPQELEEQQQKVAYPVCRVFSAGIARAGEPAAGVSPPLIVFHYGSKRSLYLALLQAAADAVGDVFDRNHGNLGNGMVLQPGYEVQIDAVKQGGLHYIEKARVISQLSWER